MCKPSYVIEYWFQVLFSGKWGEPDCEWDWDFGMEEFDSFDEAKETFDASYADEDTPIIRLYKQNYYRDEDGFLIPDEDILLMERCAVKDDKNEVTIYAED